MPTIAETNLYRIHAAKQSAKGTPATTSSMSFRQVGGTVATSIDSGSENFSDGTAFGDITTWLNSVTGTGAPVIEASTNELAWLLWIFHGAETVGVAGTNNVKTTSLTGSPGGGTIALSLDGRATTPLASTASAATIQTAVEALPNVGTGNVVGAGGPWPSAVTLTFQGDRQKQPLPPFTFTSNALTGGTSPDGLSVESTPGVNATHTFTATGAPGYWFTWWQKVGAATIQRLKMNDGRIGTVTLEASTGTKAMHVTPNMFFVDPAEVFTADQTTAMPTTPTMLYTEGASAYVIDGVTFTGTTQFQLTLNLDLSFLYGDSVTPFDLARGNPGATLATSVLFDDTMLAKWNVWLYGTAAPTAGTKPIKRIPPIGSYSANLLKKDSAGNTYGSCKITIPGVQWQLPDSPGPSPDTGSAEVALTGNLQRLGGASLYSIDVGCQSAAFTT